MNVVLNDYVDGFYDIVKDMPYGPSGMFNSEIFVVYSIYKSLNCDLFIESGLDWGVSTRKFLTLINDEYIGIDMNPHCLGGKFNAKNFTFISFDSNAILPKILEEKSKKDIFVMIDGPKNSEAINLKNKLLNYDNVKVVAIHDTYDGLINDNENRIFETMTNDEFNKKYFKHLNNIENLVNVYNLMNYNNKTYYETFNTGPGVSIYSKLNIKII